MVRPPLRRCSFCGKKQDEVRLVAGPSDVYICHLCVALCSEILAHDIPPPRPSKGEADSPGGPVQLTRMEVSSSAKGGRPEIANP